MIKEFHNYTKLFLILGTIILVAYIIAPALKSNSVTHIHNYPDTTKVNNIPNWKIIPNNMPTNVYNQIHLDSSFWKHAQNGPIITSVKVKPGEVDEEKVNSEGKRWMEVHKIEEGSTATFDNTNFNEKKASFLSQLKFYAGAGTAVNQNGFTEFAPKILIITPKDMALSGGYNFIDNSKEITIYKKFGLKKK